MRKRVLVLLSVLLLAAVPSWGSSLLYTFSSGDILATNPAETPTYGLGRIDFVSG